MIQVYAPNNTNFTNNGDEIIFPSSAEASATINGTWAAQVVHPIDDEGRWKSIVENAVIKMPTWVNDAQLFRVVKVTIDENEVTADCDPVFYDAMGELFLIDVRPENRTAQNALDYLKASATCKSESVRSKYTFNTSLKTTATAYYQNRNMLEALIGSDNSFINRWGGEAYFDNYTIKFNSRIGSTTAIELRYGKNIQADGISETIDFSDVATAIYAQGSNGAYPTRNGARAVWYSPLRDSYPVDHYKTATLSKYRLAGDTSASSDEDVVICNTTDELATAMDADVKALFDNGADKPKVTIDVKMALIENTEEYKEYASLEKVHLGDTVRLRHSKLGITQDARIISIVWDAINNIASEVTIGEQKTEVVIEALQRTQDLSYKVDDLISSALTADSPIQASHIQGVVDMMKASLKYQRSSAATSTDRAILFEDTNKSSKSYGALAIGSAGIEIANATNSDGSWAWKTAITADGITADYLIGRVISGLLLILGGNGNSKGFMQLQNADNDVMAQLAYNGFRMWDKNGVSNAEYEIIMRNKDFFINRINRSKSYVTEDGVSQPYRNHLLSFAKTVVTGHNGWSNLEDNDGEEVGMTLTSSPDSFIAIGSQQEDGKSSTSTGIVDRAMTIIGNNVTTTSGGAITYKVQVHQPMWIRNGLYLTNNYTMSMANKMQQPKASFRDVQTATTGGWVQGGYFFQGNMCIVSGIFHVDNIPADNTMTKDPMAIIQLPAPYLTTYMQKFPTVVAMSGTEKTSYVSLQTDGRLELGLYRSSGDNYTSRRWYLCFQYICLNQS